MERTKPSFVCRGRGRRSGSAQVRILVGAALISALGLALVSGAFDSGLLSLRERFRGGDRTAAAEGATATSTEEAPSIVESAPSPDTSASLEEELPPLAGPSSFDRNESAVEAIHEGRYDEAIELLEAAVAEEGEVEAYHTNLTTAYVRRARSRSVEDFALARADFEAALEHCHDEERAERIRGWMDRTETIAREEADFSVEETLHYTFKFDASRTEIREGVDRLQVLLEETYQEYGELFGRRPVEAGEKKIAVVLYGSEGFNNVTGLGDWAGGAFDGTIRVPADDLRDPRRVARLRDVLRHEVAHAFCQSIGGNDVPSWLNEGIAQWLENPERRLAGLQVARARLANARDNGGKELFKLTEVQGSLVTWSNTAEITRAYDQALAFVDYLAEQYGARLLFDLVAECKNEGIRGAEIAFERQILVDLNTVLADFSAALR
ncbi:hypothetical protein Poly30_19630 [Planctomycetes bacterium Poly30]|uniref:Tetratricopeptide repeat protein n=1 Tax=Saltatorellus ferox TaxID=2528018 RepID=A0A518EQT9_9BACT|nr:hypothetical protein Poly30_19630 [Planctomycetes bacterium Poly30]